ncbi:MAG: hypothetical protein PSV35_08045, partial [bacterium]|nr:hypothetical protein [bacterium]
NAQDKTKSSSSSSSSITQIHPVSELKRKESQPFNEQENTEPQLKKGKVSTKKIKSVLSEVSRNLLFFNTQVMNEDHSQKIVQSSACHIERTSLLTKDH